MHSWLHQVAESKLLNTMGKKKKKLFTGNIQRSSDFSYKICFQLKPQFFMPPEFSQLCSYFQNSAFITGKVNIFYKGKAIKM